MTRRQYNMAPSALPIQVQDAIIEKHRRGEPRAKILREVRATHRAANEYHVKRVLRVFKNDAIAFKLPLTADITSFPGFCAAA